VYLVDHPSPSGHCGETTMNGRSLPCAISLGGPWTFTTSRSSPRLSAPCREQQERVGSCVLLVVLRQVEEVLAADGLRDLSLKRFCCWAPSPLRESLQQPTCGDRQQAKADSREM